jgi:hypothetical protein
MQPYGATRIPDQRTRASADKPIVTAAEHAVCNPNAFPPSFSALLAAVNASRDDLPNANSSAPLPP